jgi:GR25 family glycosyltransferase involved in LPS biosynthesis
MNFKTIVINLDRRLDRYGEFLNNYRGGEHIRFSGVDGLREFEAEVYDLNNKLLFDKIRVHTGHPSNQWSGLYGCFKSHLSVWEMLARDEEADAYVIFEDDMRPVEGFEENLEFVKNNMDNTFELYYIGGRFRPNFSPSNISEWWEFNVNDLKVHRYGNPAKKGYLYDRGLFAYILTREGARNFVNMVWDDVKNKPSMPAVDEWICRNRAKIRLCDVFPHIFWSPVNYKSDIR